MAKLFLREKEDIFCKDVNNDYFFGYVISVGEESITIYCEEPKQREGQHNLPWISIIKFAKRED